MQRLHSERRLALKRKAEGDLNLEVEGVLDESLAKLWHRENDPDDEVALLIFATAWIATLCMKLVVTKRCVKGPKTPFPYDECGWGLHR